MNIGFYELDNVIKCIEERMPNTVVYLDFERYDHSSRGKEFGVGLKIRDEENDRTLFSSDYDDIFKAYPVLLGIYYGISINQDKPFDYTPTPSGADWA